MGKVLQNKLQKRVALLDSAYELFTTRGFTKTTIQNIAEGAGVAKGTFYLYFSDKKDIRNALVRSKASKLMADACESVESHLQTLPEEAEVADKFIFFIDYIVDRVASDIFLVKFISKNLLWGVFSSGPKTPQEYYNLEQENAGINFVDYIQSMLDKDNVKIRDLDVLLFTLLELISSVTYDLVLYSKPMTLEEFKPHLHRSIRLLVNDAIIE